MNQKDKNLLKFNGKNIIFRRIKGQYWIGVKSVCEALSVDYVAQFKNIQVDPILGPALSNQTMQVPGDQVRNMACLPEFLIYGWIFSINSKSEELIEYKKECYGVLFNHFHGAITRRAEIYSAISHKKRKINELKEKLNEIPEYTEYMEAKMSEARLWKNLRESAGSQDLFNEDED